jgi:uncharacterized membrane protein
MMPIHQAYDLIGRWNRRHDGQINVGRTERLVSGVAGAALLVAGMRRRRMRSLFFPLGTSLLARAVTGHCPLNRALGRNSAVGERRGGPSGAVGRGQGIRVEQSVTIGRPREELYRFWRDFENLPRFMDHLESVRVLDARRSHWITKGPAGTRVEWDAEIHQEIPNEMIAWQSLPEADVDHAGSVHFSPAPNGGTEVRVILRYAPPAGKVGAVLAGLFGGDPARQVTDDLRRFKQVMDAVDAAPGMSGPAAWSSPER